MARQSVEFAGKFAPASQKNRNLEFISSSKTSQVLDDPLDENLYLIFEGLPGGQLMNWNEQSCSYSAGPAVERSLDSCQNGIHWDGASSNPRL